MSLRELGGLAPALKAGAVVLALAIVSCTSGEPTGPGDYEALPPLGTAQGDAAEAAPGQALVALDPVFPLAFDEHVEADARSINRIRAKVWSLPDEELVDEFVQDVDPEAEEWELTLAIQLPNDGELRVFLTVELIHHAGGVEHVEWAGRTEPFQVAAERIQRREMVDLPVHRGPVDNLDVESVSVVDPPTELFQGDVVQLVSELVAESENARIFWTSLTPNIAPVSGNGVVRAMRPGTAVIVASAGPLSDTVEIEIRSLASGIEITPGDFLARSLGEQISFEAVVLDPFGDPVQASGPPVRLEWSVSDPLVARITPNGRVTTLAEGTTDVVVTVVDDPEIFASASLTVEVVAGSIRISPSQRTIRGVGSTARLSATALDPGGRPMQNAVIEWTSQDPSVATVDTDGTVTAVSVGSTQVVAAVGDQSASAGITVEEKPGGGGGGGDNPGGGNGGGDNPGNGGGDNPGNGGGDNPGNGGGDNPGGGNGGGDNPGNGGGDNPGNGGGDNPGNGDDDNPGGGNDDLDLAGASVVVAPGVGLIEGVGGTLRFTAEALDADAATLNGAQFTWTSSDESVATVSAQGNVTAVGVGDALIRATLASVGGTTVPPDGAPTGSAELQVVAEVSPVASISIDPLDGPLTREGERVKLKASAFDSGGDPVHGVSFTWTSSDEGVVTVSAQGQVKAVANGNAVVTATLGDVSGQITVEVSIP